MSPREVHNGAEEFSAAAQHVIDYLNTHTPISDWSVSRVAGGEQVHLHGHDEGLLSIGLRAPWQETLCIRMFDGAARIVPDVRLDPDYADHPDAQAIRAYVGLPITDDEGNVFGSLCGVSTAPLRRAEDIDVPLIELLVGLLSSHLRMSRTADRERRAVELAHASAHTDVLTGLVNRRGWDMLAQDAQERITAYGDAVAVGLVDLDRLKVVNDTEGHLAGDDLLRRTAHALTAAAQAGDRVARYGGDEFAILANNVPLEALDQHFQRFADALEVQGIDASMGHAPTQTAVVGVADAFRLADASMYQAKQVKRLKAAGRHGRSFL